MGQSKIRELPDLGIKLADGTRLSARVWMPQDAATNPVPAILEYLPYRKRDGTFQRDELTHPYFASYGYACLRVDIRGNGDSEGIMKDEYTPRELADAVEVIDWIAAQPWCSGPVGMMGISWGGFNALQVAALRPGPLKAIITLCSTVDRFADDIHYKGGCLLGENFGWGATMFSYSSRAPDPEIVGDKWRAMWLERLEANPLLAARWLKHQRRDDYWKHGSVCEDYSAIGAATLAIGGWGDAYKNSVQALVENLKTPVKGIIGPWIHKYPHFATPEPRIGFLQEALRWWDRWLKGLETGVENDPDLRLYLLESDRPRPDYDFRAGRWINQNFREAPTRVLHLSAEGLADAPSEFRHLVDTPYDTGADSGEFCAIWGGPDLPGDQRRDDRQSVCFDSAPLGKALAVVGAPVVRLTVECTAPVAQIAVRLNDLRPDGSVVRVTYGLLNLTHRNGPQHPVPMPTGTPVEITLRLDQIAYELPAGHQLRLSVSNAYWPLAWPAPGPASLVLHGGSVELPLINEGRAPVADFPPPECAPGANVRYLRPTSNRREFRTDRESGVVTLEITDDFGEIEILNHGMIVSSIAREWLSIHPDEPLSARIRAFWVDTMRRGDWAVRTEAESEMWSDETEFHLRAQLRAYEGETCIFEREYKEQIARKLL